MLGSTWELCARIPPVFPGTELFLVKNRAVPGAYEQYFRFLAVPMLPVYVGGASVSGNFPWGFPVEPDQ